MEKHERTSLHHETIYQLIYADKRSGGDLSTRIISPYRRAMPKPERRDRIKNRVSMMNDQRLLKDVIGRRYGYYKGRKGALLTLVERKTLYTMIRRLTGKRADLLAKEAIKAMAEMKGKERLKRLRSTEALNFQPMSR